jgi:hypothetical protein
VPLTRGPARPAEAQWGVGERPVKKNRWAAAGPAGRWADWAESEEKILFRIEFDF